jgi:hypothetical protein
VYIGPGEDVQDKQLAALHPTSGGTYVYGRQRLGDFRRRYSLVISLMGSLFLALGRWCRPYVYSRRAGRRRQSGH